MFLLRKLGSVLRGRATPLQIMLATVLGGLLGFVPGFGLPGDLGGGFLQAPALILLLLCTVLVLNANLALFGITLLVAKMVSFAMLPLSYRIGRWLLEGPMQDTFRELINGPFTAWCGLEYYATAGGLTIGLGFGMTSGGVMLKLLKFVRTRMAGIEETSAAYQSLTQKRWVRVLTWIFLGKGKGKASWADLAHGKRFGLPIRPLGVAFAALLVGSVWVFQSWFSAPVLTRNVKAGLERVAGATVDLEGAEIALGDMSVRVTGLAMADCKALHKDLLAADALVGTLDSRELWSKRFVIDELRATGARAGTARKNGPGQRIQKAESTPTAPTAGGSTIEDYLKDFETYKPYLEQIVDWIEAIAKGDGKEPTPEEIANQREEQEQAGYARVYAGHLITKAPRILVRKIAIEGITVSLNGQDDVVDLHGRNLSDAPWRVADAVSVSLAAKSDVLRLGLTGATKNKPATGLEFAWRRIPTDAVFGQLKLSGAQPVKGGTIDVSFAGDLGGGGAAGYTIDQALQVALKDTTFALAGHRETAVKELLLPIGLRGPLQRPSVSLDDKVLQDALLKAGQQELANFVQGQAGKLLGGTPLQGVVDVNKSVGENVDAAKAKLEAEATAKAKQLEAEAKAKAEAEAKRLEEEAKKKLLDAAKKKLPGLGGLVPGGGK